MISRIAAFLVLFTVTTPSIAFAGEVTVFAAASTQPVLERMTNSLKTRGITLRLVFAGSSTLARQIAAGAPADIYISAHAKWMDTLIHNGLIAAETRQNIATNQLVMIAGNQPFPAPMMVFGPGYPIDSILQGSRLALADPDHVPAGQYARQALTKFGMWKKVQDRLALTRDVTGALMLVARGEARLGIVYASDAKRTPDVHVFAPFPTTSHAPIVYPAAIIKGRDRADVRHVFDALAGSIGQAAFRHAGFGGAS